MPWKTPDECRWDGARVIDITSRLPVLTPAQEHAAMYDWWSENVVQLTQKCVQDMIVWNEERESQRLDIALQWLYLELDKEIKNLDQCYSRIGGIPTDLSAWENNNNQIFTTISSMSSDHGWIYSETNSMEETTGDNILTQGFFQEKYNNAIGKEAIFTIKTSRGVKMKEIQENGIPETIRLDYVWISKFSIHFIHQKQYQPENIQIIVNMVIYNEKNEFQDSSKPIKISEKKRMELCYREAIWTIQRLAYQLHLYR